MSLRDQILSKSCKERAEAIDSLEKEWICDKTSYSELIPHLLKEKNVIVLNKLIPSLKVLPYSADIAIFAIENFKIPRLEPKIQDYLDCKRKQLDIQLIYDRLVDKDPKYTSAMLSYLASFYRNSGHPTREQIEKVKHLFSSPNATVRRRSADLMRIFYNRDQTISLDNLKPIIIDEIIGLKDMAENDEYLDNIQKHTAQQQIVSHEDVYVAENTVNDNETLKSSVNKRYDDHKREKLSDEEVQTITENLEHNQWKQRLYTLQQLDSSSYDLSQLSVPITNRLKDPNNQVFLSALHLIKKHNLLFNKKLLIVKLADKKLQKKIKELNIIELTEDDLTTCNNPEIFRMMIEILIFQQKKEFKDTLVKFSENARGNLKSFIRRYLEFCDNKIDATDNIQRKDSDIRHCIKKTMNARQCQISKSNMSNELADPLNHGSKESSAMITQADIDLVMNWNASIEQDRDPIVMYFKATYPFLDEQDSRQRLNLLIEHKKDLIDENKLLLYIYYSKERNKVINLQFLEILSQQKDLDVFLLCEVFSKTFTDNKIFHCFLSILQNVAEKQVIVFFLLFIQKNRKGKVFECAVMILKQIIKSCLVSESIFNESKYIGKDKQILLDLKNFVTCNNRKVKNSADPVIYSESYDVGSPATFGSFDKNNCSTVHVDKKNMHEDAGDDACTGSNDNLFYNSDIENKNGCSSIIMNETSHNNDSLFRERKKNGEDFDLFFTTDIRSLFITNKIEASDFIIKYIYEEKKCICGANNGIKCCIKALIAHFVEHNYILNRYEAERLIFLINDDLLLREVEKIYPKTKIMAIRSEITGFRKHVGKSFENSGYNMSPLAKKHKTKCTNEKSIQFSTLLHQHDTDETKKNDNGTRYSNVEKQRKSSTGQQYSWLCFSKTDIPHYNTVLGRSLETAALKNNLNSNECKNQEAQYNRQQQVVTSSQEYENLRKKFEKRLSTSTQKELLVSELHKNDDNVLQKIYDRATTNVSSLFYVANSLVTGLVSILCNKYAVDILMVLSSDKGFLSELDYLTLKILHIEIIKDIKEKGGDILINICLNAPVPLLLKVYLNILDINKEIVLKLIWRNSKRKYVSCAGEILAVYEAFFNKKPSLDEMSFKIVQLHICEIVKEIGDDVWQFQSSGVLKKILVKMLELKKMSNN